jgi:oligogalacturonide lyase
MGKGKVYQNERSTYVDSYSNREVVQLTNYLGHSNHLYFTDPCWFNDGRSLVFHSDRENQSNLFRYDLDGSVITQMTALEGPGRVSGCYGAAKHCLYFWWGNVLYEMNVDTLAERVVYEARPPMLPRGRAVPTADGKYVCCMLMEEQPQDTPRVSFSYSRFREFFQRKPFSQIVRIEVATGEVEVVHEDRRYMGHVNLSPTLPEILTYCHEGPWVEIEQRIWGLNIITGETWKIRSQEGEDVAVGHEYWFADGERIGYHGRPRTGRSHHVFGHIKWDNSEHVEVSFPFHSTHFHSLDESIIVGDGTPAFVFTSDSEARPFIQLFKWDGEQYVGPRILTFHRSTFNNQHAHCHPRFTPDGKSVLYTSDLTRYSQMYLVAIDDFKDLPMLKEAT